MKRIYLTFIPFLIVAMMTSCGGSKETKKIMEFDNTLTEQEIAAGILTPEVMWKMSRLGSAAISPDGKQVIYSVTNYSMSENKGQSSLWLTARDGSEAMKLTDNGSSNGSPQWSGDGGVIYFTSDRTGSNQIWVMNSKGGLARQVSDVEGGIDGYAVSPNNERAFYVKRVAVEKRTSADVHPDMDKSKALIYDDLMARHWDYWDRGDYSHIFVAPIKGGKLGEALDIMPNEPWDAPMAPYFDNAEITWNAAGTQLAYTCKKMVGKAYAVSTNSDIFVYDIAAKTTNNFTEEMPGYDKYPVFSPDGSKIAFQSMARDGVESDKTRLFVVDLGTKHKTYLTATFDYNADNIVWHGEESLLFVSPIEATHQLCQVGMDGNVKVLTSGDHDITSFSMAQDKVVASVMKITMPNELFNVNLESGELRQLTAINSEILKDIKMGEVQKRWVTTTDGKQMLTWVILPPDFDASKKYPTILYCQGGPQSVVSQFWSYRWNLQLMAAQGYIIVAPNRRGLPSFGQEWLDQISGDYSGQNIRDYISAIDDVATMPWVDSERLGCIGASYGGYSAFYLAGVHNKRFKAFIAHCGIFNFESMYGETEELFFINNDYGGSYWSKDPVAVRSYANSPHKLVAKWDTPILIFTGLNDFRIPYTQSLQAFTAAKLVGVPSRLVAFENEAHQVFKPQNSMVWNREFFGWLDKYLKTPDGVDK